MKKRGFSIHSSNFSAQPEFVVFIRQFFFIGLFVAIGSAYSLVSGLAPLPWAEPELDAGEILLVDAKALDVIWLDTRSYEEYEQGHIPNALYLDEADWDNGLIGLMDSWITNPKPIVVYCGSESCGTSQRVAEQLRTALPDAEIYSLKGGWDAWKK